MKVLIISHTSISTHNNMGKTMLSLFSSFDKSELCQFYIYPMVPDTDKCSSYFRITDKDVLQSYYKFKLRGREIVPTEADLEKHTMFEDSGDERLYRNKKNKTAFRMLARDIMWKLSRWYSRDLEAWIREQKPTCIFAAPGISMFLYDIVLKIAKKHSLPIITYVCDDYYFMENSGSPLKRIQLSLLKRKIEKLFAKTKHTVTICDELTLAYSEKFKVPATTVMTGSSYTPVEVPSVKEKVQSMTYMGNLRCGRYLALAEIGRVIDRINSEDGTDFELRVYSGEKDEEILSVLRSVKSIKLCGFVSGDDFERALKESDALVHVESFASTCVNLTRRSVSTKIADTLAAGIPLFAYGPLELASMSHLKRNSCAVMASSKEELYEAVRACLYDYEKRLAVAKRGVETAVRYHKAETQSDILKGVIEKNWRK